MALSSGGKSADFDDLCFYQTMQSVVFPPALTILFENVRALANFERDKNKTLNFDIPALAIKRNDTTDIRQCILTMTLAERMRLGLSKSVLWYQKKKIVSGGCIKLCRKVS